MKTRDATGDIVTGSLEEGQREKAKEGWRQEAERRQRRGGREEAGLEVEQWQIVAFPLLFPVPPSSTD